MIVPAALAALMAGCAVRPPAEPGGQPAQVPSAATTGAPAELTAQGGEKRVDLAWRFDADEALAGYHVYRADGTNAFRRLNAKPHLRHVYSDFAGANGTAFRYRVTALRRVGDGSVEESPPSAVVEATPHAETDDELFESVQRASFRFFWDYGHPVSGLARERTQDEIGNHMVTSGGSGFGLMNIVVGAERGWVTRAAAAERVRTMLRFLEKADRFHGAWPHWLDGRTGRVVPFSDDDDGGDIVETAFLVQGMLTARQYFRGEDDVEREIRDLATRLWHGVEWNWYRREGQDRLTWHWSPRVGWKIGHQITGFNECMIVYILAAASPTHPVSPEVYRKGWAGFPGYARERTVYGQRLWVGPDLGGPLFFTHYSYLGFDPRGWHDGFCNYFENNRSIARIHHAYAVENPKRFAGYGPDAWGLTASDNPWGYAAQEPGRGDNGTISPTAALSSMPYVPDLAFAALKHFYHALGPRLWGEFGFRDAFNESQDWFAGSYLAIDQGPIAVMMENHRSQLCWRLFMANPEIAPALEQMGWRREEQDAAVYRDARRSVEERVDDLLGRLSADEKLDLLGGVNEFYTRGIPRLGVPELRMSDGPMGVRNYGPATAYPAGIALAATWDTNLVERVGAALGRDARARGVHFLLAPGVNIHRVPHCGRNFEYFGEDPHLAARMAVAYIRGVQGQGVAATVKHFAANNHEDDRGHDSSDVDERTLQEIYLPAFRAAVQEADVGAVMCGYNLLNGTYTSAHDWLLNGVLKKSWGFRGLVMSDWGAAHDTLGCVNGGLDLEMPSGRYMNRDAIRPLMESGQVALSILDDKVRRILRTMVARGWLDRPQEDASIPRDDPASAAVALDAARAGIVLLKNGGNLLPLDRAGIRTLALVGPNVEPAVVGGGGSSFTRPFRAVSALDGIRRAAGDAVTIDHVVDDADARYGSLAGTHAAGTFHAQLFANRDLAGAPVLEREDERIHFEWGGDPPAPQIGGPVFSARWRGRIRVETAGPYEMAVKSDDGIRLRIDGALVLDQWKDQGASWHSRRLNLEAGEHDVELEYFNAGGLSELRFAWGTPPPRLSEDQLRRIRAADAVVVCAGFRDSLEGEGRDRPFELPAEQDQLIRAVAAAHPRAVVVLNGGGAVDLRGWIDHVPALLHAWYPGQEGGTALGEILFGDVDPGARLPISMEKQWEDAAAFGHFPAVNRRMRYDEGVFVGYRHFDQHNIEPQFPFGFGLSYTSFRYDNLQITPASGGEGTRVTVSCDVVNTGARSGSEVVQLYARDMESTVPRPPKELKAFRKVFLAPGARASVQFDIDPASLAFFDVTRQAWVVEPGAFEFLVGASSRDIRLAGTFELRGGGAPPRIGG